MSKQVCSLIISRTKFVLILFMILMPLMAYISWLAAELPRINHVVYYINLVSVFSYPFVTIIALRLSTLNFERNNLVRATVMTLLPIINIAVTIICFNYMQSLPLK